MHKFWLIVRREFRMRVRNKTFVVMTLLGPIILACIMFLPAYLATLPGEEKVVVVLDHARLMDFKKNLGETKFNYLPPREFNLEDALKFYRNSGHYALLYLPAGDMVDPDFSGRNARLYTKEDASLNLISEIESFLEQNIQKEKLKAQGIDPELLARTKSQVNLLAINLEDSSSTKESTFLKMAIGYGAGFLIYIFVFLYGAQVMRGVIEEKSNRIVEVVVSSVKPFQLMLGKIVGIGGVALLQFSIWLICGLLFYGLAMYFFLGEALDPAQLEAGALPKNDFAFDLQRSFASINFPYIIGLFLFFFLSGYLLYAALFAAIGSAVDKEADTQQFMFPVSLPLLAAIVVLIRALAEPNGSLAVFFSIFPLTSPVVMMARAPFAIPFYQLALSMGLLLITFIGLTWLAARIYRVGILMYGKKASVRELIKWIRHSR